MKYTLSDRYIFKGGKLVNRGYTGNYQTDSFAVILQFAFIASLFIVNKIIDDFTVKCYVNMAVALVIIIANCIMICKKVNRNKELDVILTLISLIFLSHALFQVQDIIEFNSTAATYAITV